MDARIKRANLSASWHKNSVLTSLVPKNENENMHLTPKMTY